MPNHANDELLGSATKIQLYIIAKSFIRLHRSIHNLLLSIHNNYEQTIQIHTVYYQCRFIHILCAAQGNPIWARNETHFHAAARRSSVSPFHAEVSRVGRSSTRRLFLPLFSEPLLRWHMENLNKILYIQGCRLHDVVVVFITSTTTSSTTSTTGTTGTTELLLVLRLLLLMLMLLLFVLLVLLLRPSLVYFCWLKLRLVGSIAALMCRWSIWSPAIKKLPLAFLMGSWHWSCFGAFVSFQQLLELGSCLLFIWQASQATLQACERLHP